MKEKLTSREWEELKALGRLEFIGSDRRDIGLVRAALFIGSCMAKLGNFDAKQLLPNPPPAEQQTADQMFDVLLNLGKQWQPKALEHSPPS